MSSSLSLEERLALIKENTAEILDIEIIEDVLKKGEELRIYWGTATTGRPHTGYFVSALKIAQFLKAGCHVTILLADIHGFLDNLKAPIEIVEYRATYYQFCITSILKAVGVSIDKLKFVRGSSYQKTPEYIMDVYKMASLVSEHDAKKAGAEVVKQSDNSPLSGLLYPILQVLDEQHLDVHVQCGGLDQRKLFTAAKEWLPKLGYRQRAHVLTPMVPGLRGGKMSASEPDSKIDLLDSADVVTKKLKKAEAAPRVVEANGILSFTEFVLLPAGALKYGQPEFHVDRSRDGLEPLIYKDIKSIHEDYENDVLTPQTLKPAVTRALLELLEPIRKEYEASQEWQDITLKAYPPVEAAKTKKEKPKKNKGTRHPTTTNTTAGPAVTQADIKEGQAIPIVGGKELPETVAKE